MENGNTQESLKEELPQGQQSDVPKKYGFSDPEVLKKAMAASQRTRARNNPEDVSLPFKPEEYKALAKGLPEDFVPNKNMLAILREALSLDSGISKRSWFAKTGIHRNSWYEWIQIPGFSEWWRKSILKGFKDYEAEWISIGIRKMKRDTKTWVAMGELFFNYAKKLEVKEEKTDDEKQLTHELMELFTGLNQERKAKVIDVIEDSSEANEITDAQIELLQKELSEGDSKENVTT